MVEAKCQKCGGSATGSTFTEASAKINHAVGLSRGIKCGVKQLTLHPKENLCGFQKKTGIGANHVMVNL